LIAIATVLGALALPGLALAHLERPSYWPNPNPDTSVSPPAGGEVPKPRSLATAVTGEGPGDVRVVCDGKRGARSLAILRDSVRSAVKKGYRLRPSQPKISVTKKQAKTLIAQNRALAKDCEYDEIQPAVFDSGNNDRVVVMPGRYTEPTSRKQPLNDPKCASLTQQDESGALTPSYEYQVTCPNDQNLVYIQGREVSETPPPSPPLENRMGIPDEGACARCNFQLEGSGVKPTDVIVDGGKGYASKNPEAKPGELVKDVIIRADRADGIVIRNLLARGALEHGIYIEETDGYLIDRAKMFWAADYGNLTFTSDHGLYRDCDGFGSGDSVLYPGAAPETGEQADLSFYPDAPRINTTLKRCDMRGSALAYSGSMGNSVRITESHIYGNGSGISTDTISAAGHPGFPADSVEVDHNLIYSNNLNLYTSDPPVAPTVGVPVGVGILWAGHNNGRVHDNYIFDNWRRGTMLLSIPDAVVQPNPDGQVNPGISCQSAPLITTSCGNQYFNNHMGVAPEGFKGPRGLKFGTPNGGAGPVLPNGVDFWWDEFAGNTGNCWFNNTGTDGTAASVTGPGDGAPPNILPSDCGSSVGTGDVVKEAVLLDCSNWNRGDTADDLPACDWFTTPPKPGSAAARAEQRKFARQSREFQETEYAAELQKKIESYAEESESSAFADRP
jgi:hypothetical protein